MFPFGGELDHLSFYDVSHGDARRQLGPSGLELGHSPEYGPDPLTELGVGDLEAANGPAHGFRVGESLDAELRGEPCHLRTRFEIGRASCRERVSLAGVAVSSDK